MYIYIYMYVYKYIYIDIDTGKHPGVDRMEKRILRKMGCVVKLSYSIYLRII